MMLKTYEQARTGVSAVGLAKVLAFLFPQSRAYNKSSTNNIVLSGRYPVSCYRPVLLWSGIKGMTYKLHYCKEDYSGYCQKIVCSN
jgi:hypothetical protein